MGQDWYAAAIDEVAVAAKELTQSVEVALAALQQAREDRTADVPLPEIIGRLVQQGGRTVRLGPTVAFRRFEHAMTLYRAAAIRSLVDDEGMTFSEVAKLVSVSRQMVARLYHMAEAESHPEA